MRTVIATVLVVATLAALYLLYLLRSLLITAFVAAIFASALRPIIGAAERRLGLPRSTAALALYATFALGTLAGLAALVPAIAGSTLGLLDRSGDIYGRWYSLATLLQANARARLGVELPLLPAQPQVDALLAQAGDQIRQALPTYTLKAGAVLGELVLGLAMAYYWLEARDDILALALKLAPPHRQVVLRQVFDDVERVLGGYLGGQAILSALIGAACLVLFLLLGLPDAPALALASGLLHMIPILGAAVGTVLAVLVAGAASPVKGLLAGAALLLIHQLENHFVAPRVLQRQIGLNPLLVITALAGGAALDGVVGALVAIPAVGTLCILARHLVVEPLAGRQRAAQEAEKARLAQPGE